MTALNNDRPAFGQTTNVTTVQETTAAQTMLAEKRKQRPEVGAAWKRQSKTNMEYLTIRLKLTREKLQELLNNNTEEVSVDLVAFPNKSNNGNSRRPVFRIYEELT